MDSPDKLSREEEGDIARWFTSTSEAESKDRLAQEVYVTAHSLHLPPHHRSRPVRTRERSEATVTDVPEIPLHDENFARLIPYISTVGARASRDPTRPWLIDLVTPSHKPNPPTDRPQLSRGKLAVTGLSVSKSPETLRFWSVDLGRDVYCSFRSADSDKNLYRAALTAEDVKKRWKTLYAWARKKGYWKDMED